MTRQQYADYNQSNTLRIPALVNMALKAGIDPGQVYLSLIRSDVGYTPSRALAAMGLPADTIVTTSGPGVNQTPVLTTAQGQPITTGVYSNAENQSVINQGYRNQADTIQSASRQKMDALIQQGYTPAMASSIAESWATEQIAKSKLSGAADLTAQSVGLQNQYMSTLAGMNTGTQGTAGYATQAANNSNNQQSELWSAVAGLANVLGQTSATKTTSTAATPTVISGSTQTGGSYGYGLPSAGATPYAPIALGGPGRY
jgi:hypothetical protein